MTASAARPAAVPADSSRPRSALIVLAIGALIAALHSPALNDGLFMDDHAHYRQLRAADWSLSGLTDACRLELNGGPFEMWWMPPALLRFFRPVSFALMKLTYTLTDWNPLAAHAASLLWHWLACALLFTLLRRVGAPLAGAAIAAALFAIHPGHVATVQWIAAQSELMVTCALLAATLCFATLRGWAADRAPALVSAHPGAANATSANPKAGGAGLRSLALMLATIALYLAALGCRENAILFPLVLVVGDLCFGPPDRRRLWTTLVALAAAAAAYLVVRGAVLGGVTLPPKPYVFPPGEPGFARYVFDKACYYLLGEFAAVPCVPFGGLAYLRDHPAAFYGGTLALTALCVTLALRSRRRAAVRFGIAWLLATIAPLLPAFEAPHHLYLPGVGSAIVAAVLFGALWGDAAPAGAPPRWRRRTAFAIVSVGGLAGFGIMTQYFSLALDTAQRVEDRIIDELASASPPLRDGDRLYVANVPLIAYFAILAVEDRASVRNLKLIALTWAPRLLGMATPAELIPRDDRSFVVRIAEDRFFSGPLGELARLASGRPTPLVAGEQRLGDGFCVALEPEAGSSGDDGVASLRFTFDEPLDVARGRRLFWGSRTRWAAEVTPGCTPFRSAAAP
ncbi:MAG: hypothetical protein AB7Q17_00285 [Phycisphaerae bacterium]